MSIHADIQTVINNESGNSTFLSQLVYMGNAIEPKEIILGGDPQQLRARVQTTFAKENNINISLMELYLEAYGLDMTNLTNTTLLNESCEICMLKTSYRCQPSICDWLSTAFYNNNYSSAHDTCNNDCHSLTFVHTKGNVVPDNNKSLKNSEEIE